MSRRADGASPFTQLHRKEPPALSHNPSPESSPSSRGADALFVVGMHRSGTSAMAGVLRYLEVELGERLIPAQAGVNDQGFWEHQDVVDLHDRIFHWVERDWHDVRSVSVDMLSSRLREELVAHARTIIRRSFGAAPCWAIKDPRLALVLPAWHQAALEEGARPHAIITLRHPFEVADSLGKRDALTRVHGLLLWGQHLSAAVRASADMPRTVVEYAALLADWRGQIHRVADEFGFDWSERITKFGRQVDDFLSADLRRQRSAEEPGIDGDALTASVFQLYRALASVAQGASEWSQVVEAVNRFTSIEQTLVPHVHELLGHVYMHDARARSAQALIQLGLDDKGALLSRIDERLAETADWIEKSPLALESAVTEGLQTARIGFDAAMEEREARARALAEELRRRDAWLAEIREHAGNLERRRNELETTLVESQVALELVREERNALSARTDQLTQIFQAQDARMSGLMDRLREKDSWLDEVRRHADGLERVLLEERGLKSALELEIDDLRTRLETAAAELSEYKQSSDALAAVVNEHEQLLHAKGVELDGARALVRTVEDQLSEREAMIGRLEVTAARLQGLLADAQSLATLRGGLLDAVVRSRSWTITAPMRWLLANARAVFGRPASRLTMSQAKSIASLPGLAAPPKETISQDATAHGGEGSQSLARSPHTASDPNEVSTDAGRLVETLYGESANGRAAEFVAAEDIAPPRPGQLRAKAIAFYLPQFHPIPENAEWWGRGFTEWTNVTKARPQFEGHYQPHLPGELGFYDLRLESSIRQQVDLARQYGLHGFCFHYYWFGGRRLLRQPLDIFFDAGIDFPFCLCWANENWTRRWDGYDSEVLMSQVHGADNDLAFIQDLEPYLRDSRYIRVDGRPLVSVYRPSILPDAAATLKRWRQHCRDVGIGEIFLAMVQFDALDPTEYGFDAAMEFPPHKLAGGLDAINHSLDILNPGYQGHVVHYQSIVDRAREWPVPDYPLVRSVFPGWDNEARRPGKGYTFAFSSPARYKDWLSFAVQYAEQRPVAGERLVMINAWNEWAEGAHLEPDRRYGRAYLQATREVLERSEDVTALASDRPRITVVSHDAHPHGAQYLALHLVRELSRTFGYGVDVVLLGEGELAPAFAEVATVHDASAIRNNPVELGELARRLVAGGAEAAIVNTTVSGYCAPAFKGAGVRVVSLVHELPRLIADYDLQAQAVALAEASDHVVFAAPQVRDGFAGFAHVDSQRIVIRPQGLFVRSRHIGASDHKDARLRLRQRLGIPQASKVVLAVGYGDTRKGVDLFCRVAGHVRATDPEVHFVWVGHHDAALVESSLRGVGKHAAGVHFIGKEFDTDDFYAGADLYALTSREDPFPSVLLESLAVGTPVVAFKGAGGADELLQRFGGRLVPRIDASMFADVVLALLGDENERRALGAAGARGIAAEFSFRKYVFDLLSLAGIDLPRVSVIVPNYNYAHLIGSRLKSVYEQSLPPFEVIVLDDQSSDDSLSEIARLQCDGRLDMTVVAAEKNSGSVFRQWRKGVEIATGDYVWIAEADDLSERDFLKRVVGSMDADIAMAYSESRQIDELGNEVAHDYRYYTDAEGAGHWDTSYTCSGKEEMEHGLGVKNTIPNVSAVVFRRDQLRSVLDQKGEEIAEYRVAGDWLTYAHVLRVGKVAFVAESLNIHRRHSVSVTRLLDAQQHLGEIAQVQEIISEMYGLGSHVRAKARDYLENVRADVATASPEAAQ